MAESLRVNVRQPSWRGRQEVAALWFPHDWLSVEQRQHRLLQCWVPGSLAWRFTQGDLLCWPAPRSSDCARVPGVPLCRIKGRLHAAPLSATEQAALPACDVVLIDGAQAQPLQLEDAQRLDVAAWLDASDYAIRTLYDLSLPASTAKLPQLEGKGVREVLGEVIPAPSSERESLLEQLGRGSGGRRSPLDALRDALPRLAGEVARLLPRATSGAGSDGAGVQAGGVAARRPPPAPSAWRRRLERLAATSRVSKLIGHRQGAYMRRMLAMFEDGDLHEALRHALPLSNGGNDDSIGQAFGTPGRRSSLDIGVRHAGGRVSINLDPELDNYLRRTYQAAFERFDRAGRFDEALFVLAELLCERQRALDYLVQHGRHAQAAELALGWDMPAANCIRLLVLAGDLERAVQVARRDNAFADAIAQLEPEHRSLTGQLRVSWGQALVEQGDWLGAVDAVWPVAAAHGQARQWLSVALQGDGELHARALVRCAQLLPDQLEACLPALDRLLDIDAEPAPREAMLAVLRSGGGIGRARDIARLLLPVLAADRALGRVACTGKDLDRLLKLADDPLLSADVPGWKLPPLAATQHLQWRSEPLRLRAPQAGLWALQDVLALPGRRYLAALGESGALLLDAYGQVQQRYAVPTWQLVAGGTGGIALALARRERNWHVYRFDLVTQTVHDLGQLDMDQHAPSMNGLGWTIRRGQHLRVLDTGRGLDQVLWQVEVPEPLLACSFFASREVCLVGEGDRLQEWSWALPGRRRLLARSFAFDAALPLLAAPLTGMLQPRVSREGQALQLRHEVDGRSVSVELDCFTDREWESLLPGGPGLQLQVLQSGLLWVQLGRSDLVLGYLVRVHDGHCVARVEWPADALLRLRDQTDNLVLHDDRGRVLSIDLATSTPHALSLR